MPTRLPGSPAGSLSDRRHRVVTKSSYAEPQSSRERDVARTIVLAMDAVAIVIGFAMFAILLWMIEGIDRV
jgi:multisubunit Na+/H+ antiporter MnhC subunit